MGRRSPIDIMCQDLVHEVRMNDSRKPEERLCYTATVVGDYKKGSYIVLNGSDHQMKDSFVELFKRRPALRAVVQEALDSMYRVEEY